MTNPAQKLEFFKQSVEYVAMRKLAPGAALRLLNAWPFNEPLEVFTLKAALLVSISPIVADKPLMILIAQASQVSRGAGTFRHGLGALATELRDWADEIRRQGLALGILVDEEPESA